MDEIKYKQPVILEALLELRVKPSSAWSISSFVEFAGLAKEHGYPVLKDAESNFQVEFPIGTGRPPAVTPVANRIQTWNESGTQLWQASPQLYAANRRSPYEGWNKFRPHILEGWELYHKIANPEQAEVLIMRYINRIELEEPDLNPADFLRFAPPMIQYAGEINNFICKTDQSFTDREHISVTSARDMNAPDEFAVLLDISCSIEKPGLMPDVLESLIDKAHTRIKDAFEKSITDKLRERMGRV